MQLYQSYYHSPLGVIEVKNTTKGLVSAAFVKEVSLENHSPLTLEIISSLKEYFVNKKPLINFAKDTVFTNFQKRVYELLQQEVPLGKTVSYKELALKLKSSPRAIGGAMASNPICLFIPCHRVIKADGSLNGYAYGIDLKKSLLLHEGVL